MNKTRGNGYSGLHIFWDSLVLTYDLTNKRLTWDDLIISHFNLSTEKSTVSFKALFLNLHPNTHIHRYVDCTGETSTAKTTLAAEGNGGARLPALQEVLSTGKLILREKPHCKHSSKDDFESPHPGISIHFSTVMLFSATYWIQKATTEIFVQWSPCPPKNT